jgi:hypothetical protein
MRSTSDSLGHEIARAERVEGQPHMPSNDFQLSMPLGPGISSFVLYLAPLGLYFESDGTSIRS